MRGSPAAALAGLVVLATLVAPVAAAGGGQDAPSGAGDGATTAATSRPTVGVSVGRAPAAITYRVSLADLAGVGDATLAVRTDHVRSIRGFARETAGNVTRLVWDGETSRPTATLVAPATTPTQPSGRRLATDRFAFGSHPSVAFAWAAPGGAGGRVLDLLGAGDRPGITVAPAGAGLVGDRFALLGDTDATTGRLHGRPVSLVAPAGTEPEVGPARLLRAFRAADEALPVGEPRPLTLFVLPDPARRGGATDVATAEGWVHADTRLADADTTWLHEYVHTRQRLTLGPEMRWFEEASAEYLAAHLAVRTDLAAAGAGPGAFPGGAGVLAEPRTWSDRRVPYDRGARVLAALEARLRAAGDGTGSVAGVLARANAHEGRFTYRDFRAAVAAEAGTSLADWLDARVRGGAPVAGAGALASVPADPGVPTGAGGTALGGGLTLLVGAGALAARGRLS